MNGSWTRCSFPSPTKKGRTRPPPAADGRRAAPPAEASRCRAGLHIERDRGEQAHLSRNGRGHRAWDHRGRQAAAGSSRGRGPLRRDSVDAGAGGRRRPIGKTVMCELHRRIVARSQPAVAGVYSPHARRIAGSAVVFPNPMKAPSLMELLGRNLETAPPTPEAAARPTTSSPPSILSAMVTGEPRGY